MPYLGIPRQRRNRCRGIILRGCQNGTYQIRSFPVGGRYPYHRRGGILIIGAAVSLQLAVGVMSMPAAEAVGGKVPQCTAENMRVPGIMVNAESNLASTGETGSGLPLYPDSGVEGAICYQIDPGRYRVSERVLCQGTLSEQLDARDASDCE